MLWSVDDRASLTIGIPLQEEEQGGGQEQQGGGQEQQGGGQQQQGGGQGQGRG